MLFKKLSELTRQSPIVLLTLSREGPKLRLTITPKHACGRDDDEDGKVEPHEAALVTPLSIVGTAEELDAGIVAELDRYCGCHAQLTSAVADYEEEMTVAKLGVKAKTADHQKKRGAVPALSAPKAPAAPAADGEPAAGTPAAPARELTGKAAELAAK